MTDYAAIHECKEARRCGTPGVCIHHEYQHISKDVMQDILEYMHILQDVLHDVLGDMLVLVVYAYSGSATSPCLFALVDGCVVGHATSAV